MTITTDNRSVPKTTKSDWCEWQGRGLSSIKPPASVQRDDPSATARIVSTLRQNIATAKISHLSAIITELNQLRTGLETDANGERQRPTVYAYDTCCNLLVEAAIDDHRHQLDSSTSAIAIPMGLVSPDGRGGLRIEWIRNHASVHLVVPPDDSDPAYIYTEAGDEYGTEDADYTLLAKSLLAIH